MAEEIYQDTVSTWIEGIIRFNLNMNRRDVVPSADSSDELTEQEIDRR